jgi:hypothetical protein
MKAKVCLVLRSVIVISWILIGVGPEAAQRNKIREDMRQKVRERGVLGVIVGLNEPWKPLGSLTPAERIARQKAIIAAQDQLLAELAGTQYRLIRLFIYDADLVLEVGPDALAVLENSNLVETVEDDTPVPPL